MEIHTLDDLRRAAGEVLDIGDPVRVRDAEVLRCRLVDPLVRATVFAADIPVREAARYLLHGAAMDLGAWPASIQELYLARGRGEVSGFTVPAINVRGLTYDVARAAFRAARQHGVGALVFEIARSEIGYTGQRPAEYAAVVLAAALREEHNGPVFLQGDHFQVNAARFLRDPAAEVQAVKELIREAVAAHFWNIDIDTSTLVDLSRTEISAQQRENFRRSAELTAFVRGLEPPGVTISVGGEIGEVGGKNSTVEELTAYMEGLREELGSATAGPSKISVQTGTTHGGVPLPDGTVARVNVDFDVLRDLSRVARERFGMAGAVQHGASTLPEDAFDHFPRTETAEVHLATGFQNLILDHPALPDDLRQEVREHCFQHLVSERKPGWTDEQFLYRCRKKAFGPLKQRFWDLPAGVRGTLGQSLEERFELLFRRLRVDGTRDLVTRWVNHPAIQPAPPAAL